MRPCSTDNQKKVILVFHNDNNHSYPNRRQIPNDTKMPIQQPSHAKIRTSYKAFEKENCPTLLNNSSTHRVSILYNIMYSSKRMNGHGACRLGTSPFIQKSQRPEIRRARTMRNVSTSLQIKIKPGREMKIFSSRTAYIFHHPPRFFGPPFPTTEKCYADLNSNISSYLSSPHALAPIFLRKEHYTHPYIGTRIFSIDKRLG